MSNILVPKHAKILMDIRLGRVNGLESYIKSSPNAINDKIQTSSASYESLLELAVRFGHHNVAMWLLNRGAVETPQSSPRLLYSSVICGDLELSKLFTQKGWDPWVECHGASPFKIAISDCSFHFLKMWDSLGVDILQVDKDESNLLHILGLFSRDESKHSPKFKEVGMWLISKGVSWNAENNLAITPKDLFPDGNLKTRLDDCWQERCALISKKEIKDSLGVLNNKTSNRKSKI